jgi:hypothetical protein
MLRDSLTYRSMAYRSRPRWPAIAFPYAVTMCLTLGSVATSDPAVARADDFDSSHCKSAFAAGDYASATKYCRAEAETMLNKVSEKHLQGDQKAYTLGIAAIQMELLSAAQSRTGVASDGAQAPRTLNEARRLIHAAINSCQSTKCRDAMQHTANRIDSDGAPGENNSS